MEENGDDRKLYKIFYDAEKKKKKTEKENVKFY